MAQDQPIAGATAEDAQQNAWKAFRDRLPALLRPDGATASAEAQEAKWGADDKATVFRRLMHESQRARDDSGWHTPDETQKATEGDDRIDELTVGSYRIGQLKPEELIKQAWDRLATGG